MSIIDVNTTLEAIGKELLSLTQRQKMETPLVIGIKTGGVWIAEYIRSALGTVEPTGELDISFYRDDFTRIGLNPKVTPSHLPFSIDDRPVILVDDVVMSGRTVRAAMNELFDYGRPASITLVALVDICHRELPIQPDIVGVRLSPKKDQRIKLKGPKNLSLVYVSATNTE